MSAQALANLSSLVIAGSDLLSRRKIVRMDEKKGLRARKARATSTKTPLDIEPIYRAIGQRIKTTREAKGMTVRDLAGRMKVSHGWIGNVEGGIRRIAIHDLISIAKILDVSFEFLLQG